MIRPFVTILLLILCAAPAARADDPPPSWVRGVLGGYGGKVVNSGRSDAIDTTFGLDADGRLVGRYLLHEPTGDVEGTIDGFKAVGENECLMTWHDRYGSGAARFRFRPDLGRFSARWGVEEVDEGLFWTGQRTDLGV